LLSTRENERGYLWKDENGGVIYVGKAKSLKNRLSSYFVSARIENAHPGFPPRTIEYITTDNEYEASSSRTP
jgi:excinuclease ABC subunit C